MTSLPGPLTSNKLLSKSSSGLATLNEAEPYLHRPVTVSRGMEILMQGLLLKRCSSGSEEWRAFCEQVCRRHPIYSLLQQDPITQRAATKPRGYPGDAVLLDLLYQDSSVQSKIRRSGEIGRAIYAYLTQCPSAASVRWRRAFLARLIDETAERVSSAEILSIACGHLRESTESTAVCESRLKRLVALDSDARSLEEVAASKNGWNVECVQGDIKDLLRGRNSLGRFDLIYSAGLYDYLNDSTAGFLTRVLFKMLKTGGRLLIANFMPQNNERAYMEAFMDWQLIYRTERQFEQIASPLTCHIRRIFPDDNRYVVYLELEKS